MHHPSLQAPDPIDDTNRMQNSHSQHGPYDLQPWLIPGRRPLSSLVDSATLRVPNA